MNTNITARIKTKHAVTRSIERKAGVKQGGINFGFLFAKMMDVMAEDAETDRQVGVQFDDNKIAVLEWVDDVTTLAIGEHQQNYTLEFVNEFAWKHELKWGADKCNVMEIGNTAYKPTKWTLGKQEIDSCDAYKYLGDLIMRNGSNKKNIEERENKVMASTRKILSLCGNAVFKGIRLLALLKMHNCCTMAGLLTNCETWVLNKSERSKLERIELWALKRILDVPKTTPTAAVWHVTGMLMTSILIDKRQMLYLKKILNKPEDNWIKQMFYCLMKDDIGWAKQIRRTLTEYEITASIDDITTTSNAARKTQVTNATEKEHKEKLVDLCLERGCKKTKTRY